MPAPITAAHAQQSLVFASGRTVVLEHGLDERLVVHDTSGRFEVGIRFTAAGPVLEVLALGLQLRADAAVTLDCDRLHVRARDRITLDAHGDLVERIGGDRRAEIVGTAETVARAVAIEAVDGDVDVLAADDARVIGRRVLLNP